MGCIMAPNTTALDVGIYWRREMVEKGVQKGYRHPFWEQIPDGMHNGTEYHGFGRRDILASRDGRERCPEKRSKSTNSRKRGVNAPKRAQNTPF